MLLSIHNLKIRVTANQSALNQSENTTCPSSSQIQKHSNQPELQIENTTCHPSSQIQSTTSNPASKIENTISHSLSQIQNATFHSSSQIQSYCKSVSIESKGKYYLSLIITNSKYLPFIIVN
ncbi:hypothetical protein CDAR_289521 [Caerostris darwini]|uniref:Uncharacterized protein n=1 Tax=Caerostris darwini TaxID=1538125 RepID=A0AAV4UGP3_9ARAC|nr:hypothetical protein CDAR_289521 [Caerostris darwini]